MVEALPQLNPREEQVLDAVVHLYITTAEPVGARVVVKRFNMELSPATVRNVMADLEDMGLLTQPHTSAGRIPTTLGYRYYVQKLSKVQELGLAERRKLEKEFFSRLNGMDDVLRQASHLLALASHHAGLAEAPGDDTSVLRRLELISLGERTVAALLVDNFGRARSVSVELSHPMNMDLMQRLNTFLNEQLNGQPVIRLGDILRERVTAYLEEQRQLAQQALALLGGLPLPSTERLYLEGMPNLMNQPEFHSVDNARTVLNLVEERDRLLEVLRKAVRNEPDIGALVLIGSEELGDASLDSISLVASPYRVHNETVGVIGILGPRRMPYSRLMSLVNATADMVGRAITRLLG